MPFVALLGAAGCGSGSDGPPPTPLAASIEPTVGLEGQAMLVVHLTGQDFSTVTGPPRIVTTREGPGVTDAMPEGAVEVTDWLCNAVRCGVALRVGKWRHSTGEAVPRTILGEVVQVMFDTPNLPIAGTVNILPLDAGGAGSPSSPPRAVRTALYSSFALGADVVLDATDDGSGLPVRIFVTGDVTFGSGSGMDASGSAGSADPRAGGSGGPGGGDGGALGADAERPTGGRGGDDGATGPLGGGGGGFGSAGSRGDSPTTPGAGAEGGATAETPVLDCLRANSALCGGGGGGSAGSGEGGGGGGGGLLLAVLGSVRVPSGRATLRSNGGAGADGNAGGGGGAGGAVALACNGVEGSVFLQAIGGEGGRGSTRAHGGDGGNGRVRIDAVRSTSVSTEAATSYSGPVVDLASIDPVTADATITLTGTGTPHATVAIVNSSTSPASRFEGAASDDGAFSIVVSLEPGLNELEVSQRTGPGEIEAASLTGTTFVIAAQTVAGARIHIVRVPEVE